MRRTLALALLCLLPAAAPGGEFFTLKGHGGPVMGIAVSPGGQIATASFDNSVGLWRGGKPHWFEGHRAAVNEVLFWDSATLISAGDDFTIRAWPRGGGEGREIGRHQGKVAALAASPATGLIASASWDGTIGLWTLGGAGRFLAGHGQAVNDVVFSGDGATLYSASADGTIRAWSGPGHEEMQVLVKHGFGVNRLLLNETDGWLAYGAVDGVTRVIDPDTGTETADFTLDRRPILALALSPDRSRIAVGDGEGYIMVIDTRGWAIAQDFRATMKGPVWALAFSADGSSIYAGGLDTAMYSWPLDGTQEAAKMAAGGQGFLRDPAEMSNGERQFARKCSICHSLTPSSARRAGPTLFGLFGRKAGTVPGYRYSDILDGAAIVWDETTIDALFEQGPDHFIPGSKMPMQRITGASDRADLIAWLRRATAREKK